MRYYLWSISGKSSRKVVARARRLLQDVGARIIGVVLNKVETSGRTPIIITVVTTRTITMEQMRQRIRRAWEYKLGSVRGLTLRQKPGADDCGFELFHF
jgi:hypothetical protein